MKYSPYLKEIGMSRWTYFRLKHFNLRNELERIKYGTNCHEMWVLDTLLCCEIYVRLKHLHDKYHYVCNFADHSISSSGNSAYEDEANRRFESVLFSLRYVIKSYCDNDEDEQYKLLSDEWKAYQEKIRDGFKYLGEGLWGVGI